MKINSRVIINLDFPGVKKKIEDAGGKGLKEVIVAIARDSKHDTPYKFGVNRGSIEYKHKGLTGAVYSTSGYGGWLEVGTHSESGGWKMQPRPYMKPALDRHIGKLDGLVRKEMKDDFGF